MAYKTEELEAKALEAIKTHNLFFFSDLLAYLPCSKQTMYDHELDQLDTIKEALEHNKLVTKNGLRSKWYKSSAPAVQIALYKLISDDDERKKISQGYTDITSGGEKLKGATIEFADPEQTEDTSTTLS